MQLLAIAVPYFQKMQREGESGRKKISMYTRWLTVAILLFQAPELPDKPQDAGWKCPGNGHFLVCIHDSGHYNPRGRKYVYPVVRRAHY